jgi:hypothetical protein
MRVSWVTYLPTVSLVKYRPITCEYSSLPTAALADEASFLKVDGHSKKFNEGTDYLPRFQYIHIGVMPNLSADCVYEYTVGNNLFWSKLASFSGRTPDYSTPYNDYNKPAKVILFGDLGTGSNAKATRRLLEQEADLGAFDAVVHIGDIAYDLHDNYGEVGDHYLRMMQTVISRAPYMTIPGNHEVYNNATHYKARFQMPYTEANQGTGYFFSFNLGPAHFVLLNTEIVLDPSDANETLNQMNWLKEDLAKANQEREIRPWVIVGSHHPLYCSVDWRIENYAKHKNNIDCGIDGLRMQKALEELFYENGVDMYFQAHVHNYERTSAIYKNQTIPSDFDSPNLTVNPKAPIYITSGNAGNSEGHNDKASTTPQDWSRYLSNDYGYGRITVHNSTHLHWEQISSPLQQVIDFLWVVKDKPRYS